VKLLAKLLWFILALFALENALGLSTAAAFALKAAGFDLSPLFLSLDRLPLL